ncbi:uncharacterized protein LOC133032017 [Cannabis sativa]|uniref:uncharacterized protein LOC133032017 n=1 Tax=Cannabis sativa TaxID=3483 RepID=UPI0029C9FF7C|nr:uncharacterized protein LOC133032017 [Cannabis sativa]
MNNAPVRVRPLRITASCKQLSFLHSIQWKMPANRSWMKAHRRSAEFRSGVDEFVAVATNHVNADGLARCPCMRCLNVNFHTPATIRVHLFLSGIQPSYNPWYFHGETFSQPAVELPENDEEEMADVLADMLRGDPGFDESANTTDSFNEPPINDNNKFDDLFKEMEAELYPGCKKSALNALVKLMHCKVLNRWSNHSFDMLLSILIDLFPEGTKLPKSHYESKMRLRNLGLGYDSIDVCKYNCAIFWKENEKKEFCPVCGESRWVKRKGKGKKVPHKVMRYFPLTPRLKRLYCSRHTAEDMRWHYSQRPKEDGVLRHPVDAEEWKQFDRLHPSFAVEPRNVRLGLATDGFNPFGHMSNSYSLWPVICVPYNLPPVKCMSSESLLLTLLIPGPSSPGKDIDVFMRPLIDELKQLWETGVETRDAYNGTVFSMRAAVLWTINDFPAYALMSGWSTKGYMACPTCNEHTPSIGLNSKIGYVGHRRFLEMSDPRRRSKKYNGKPEKRAPPPVLTGDDILSQLDRIPLTLPGKHKQFGGVKRKRSSEELNWSKKSIFFELEYWKSKSLRHNLDVMHIEKNVCDSLVGTLLSIDGKSKDTDKARMDLQDLQIRRELWLYEDRNGKWKKPPASYTLSVQERIEFADFIKSVRFPESCPSGRLYCESFVVNEALTFCSMYFREVETRFNRPDRNNDIVQNMPTRQFSVFKHVGRPLGMRTVDTLPMQSKRKAEWYILNNCTEVEPYINEHKELLQARGVCNIETVQETEFPEWFKTQINELRLSNQGAVSDELYAIANPANTAIYLYPGCIVNGIKFLVKERDDNRKTQNSGVMVPGEDGQNFYGTLEKIMEFTYLKDCSVLLFFCKWFDTNGSRMDSDGVITSICVNRQWYQNEPFILASQAKLIYYIPDLKNGKDWLIVNEYIPRNVWDFPDTDGETPFVQENNSAETEFVVQLPQLDDVDYVRHDVDPTEVANIHRVNSQPQQLDDFIVDDDNEGLNTEEDNSLELESDSDDNAVYVTDDEDDEL